MGKRKGRERGRDGKQGRGKKGVKAEERKKKGSQ